MTTTQYLAAPTLRQMYVRNTLGACGVCGLCSPRCYCRYCAGCLNYWRAGYTWTRTEDTHDGVEHAECPDCVAWAAALATEGGAL